MSGDRIVTVDEIKAAYKVSSNSTIHRWQKKKENPFPAPVAGGRGRTNKSKWLRSALAKWEVREYGAEIAM